MVGPLYLSWSTLARPKVAIAIQAPLAAGHFDYVYRSPTHALHLHDYEGVIRLGGDEHRLAPGTLTLSPKGEDSSYALPRAGTHWCIHFSAAASGHRLPAVDVPLVQSLGKRRQEGIARFVNVIRLRSLFAAADSQSTAGISAAMSVACQELLLWAAMLPRMDARGGGPLRHAMIDSLTDYIDRNLHRPLRVADLVAHAGFTQNYLARLFRRHTSATMPAYIVGRRVALANLLLTTTNLSIKQVALRVGIADAQQFNKQFRRITGDSPSATRRLNVARS